MFKFLKGVVAGSGTGPKDLPYNIGEPYSSAWGSWTHSRGTSKVSSFFHLIRFSDCRFGSDPSRPVLLSNSRSRLVRFDELFWKLLFVCGIGIGASLLGFWIWFWVQFRFLPRLMRSCYGWSGFWIVSWFLVCAIQFWRVGKLRDGKNIWSWLLIWYILFLRSLSGSSIAQSRAEIKLSLEWVSKLYVSVCLGNIVLFHVSVDQLFVDFWWIVIIIELDALVCEIMFLLTSSSFHLSDPMCYINLFYVVVV